MPYFSTMTCALTPRTLRLKLLLESAGHRENNNEGGHTKEDAEHRNRGQRRKEVEQEHDHEQDEHGFGQGEERGGREAPGRRVPLHDDEEYGQEHREQPEGEGEPEDHPAAAAAEQIAPADEALGRARQRRDENQHRRAGYERDLDASHEECNIHQFLVRGGP